MLVFDVSTDLASSILAHCKYFGCPSAFSLFVVFTAADEEKSMIVTCADLEDTAIAEDIGYWVDQVESCALNYGVCYLFVDFDIVFQFSEVYISQYGICLAFSKIILIVLLRLSLLLVFKWQHERFGSLQVHVALPYSAKLCFAFC